MLKSRRILRRRSSSRRGRIRRRTNVRTRYSRKPRRKGMYKIKTLRWPAKNPFGDRLFYKCKAVWSQNFVLTAANGVNFDVKLNDMPAWANLFGNAPGLTEAASSYGTYRISGAKLKATYWTPSTSENIPLIGYMDASPTSSFLTFSIGNTMEQRWCRYKILNQANQGGKPTTVSAYYSVNDIVGRDNITKGDLNYVAQTNGTNPVGWNAPNSGPYMRCGMATLSGATATVTVTVKFELTLYLKFFNRVQDAT